MSISNIFKQLVLLSTTTLGNDSACWLIIKKW